MRCSGLFGIIGGISGAKLLYLIVDFPNLIASPETALLRLASGGAIFYGGLIGGILGGYLYTHVYHLNAIEFFDIAVPCLALAQAFGRIGCFFNGCCYGIPYNGPGAVHYPVGALSAIRDRAVSRPVIRIGLSICTHADSGDGAVEKQNAWFYHRLLLNRRDSFRFINWCTFPGPTRAARLAYSPPPNSSACQSLL